MQKQQQEKVAQKEKQLVGNEQGGFLWLDEEEQALENTQEKQTIW